MCWRENFEARCFRTDIGNIDGPDEDECPSDPSGSSTEQLKSIDCHDMHSTVSLRAKQQLYICIAISYPCCRCLLQAFQRQDSSGFSSSIFRLFCMKTTTSAPMFPLDPATRTEHAHGYLRPEAWPADLRPSLPGRPGGTLLHRCKGSRHEQLRQGAEGPSCRNRR